MTAQPRTLEQLANVGAVRFRPGHVWVKGRCERCGVDLGDFSRWPTMLCNPGTSLVTARERRVIFEVAHG